MRYSTDWLRWPAVSRMTLPRFTTRAVVILALAAGTATLRAQPPAPTDLDALMARAIAHRDANWKKLPQYLLDEREDFEVHTPTDAILLADHREYAWFIRDNFFVRSPVRANGVAISDDDRRKYEQDWLNRERRREKRAVESGRGRTDLDAKDADDPGSLVRQSREPRFVSAGYLLEFVFEPGNYFLAGKETLNGRNVLRVEYLPSKLFSPEQARNGRGRQNQSDKEKARQEKIDEQMNKTALVTIWVDPASAEVVRYTFENLGLDFLPGSWLLRATAMRATVNMTEPFPDVWLPSAIDVGIDLSLATGPYALRYNLNYFNYRLPAVRSTVRPSPQ